MELTTTLRGGTLTIRMDAAGVEAGGGVGGFGNGWEVRGGVMGPGGEMREVALNQVGPGLYEASMPADEAGNYVVTLLARSPDGERRTVIGGASRPPGMELRQLRSNDAALREIAAVTGGRVYQPGEAIEEGLYRRDRDMSVRSLRPAWGWLIGPLLVLFLLDVANRRLAWGRPGDRGVDGVTGTVAGRAAGERRGAGGHDGGAEAAERGRRGCCG